MMDSNAWPVRELLRAAGLIYIAATMVGLALALSLPRGRMAKLLCAVLVASVASIPLIKAKRQADEANARAQEFAVRQAQAKALFEERCKSAGEKVAKSADGVEGVVWERWREKGVNLGDQFKLDDPYGKDCGMEGCIRQMLRPSGIERFPALASRYPAGFSIVQTIDPADGVRYEYTARIKPVEGNRAEFERSVEKTGFGAEPEGVFIALEKRPIPAFTLPYSVTWRDISTPQDRQQWIAGGSVTVTDRRSGETIAERTGYLWDPGLGSTAGGRSPWAWAKHYGKSCPAAQNSSVAFVLQVLRPTATIK